MGPTATISIGVITVIKPARTAGEIVFSCPWCGTASKSSLHGIARSEQASFLLVQCQLPTCRNATLIALAWDWEHFSTPDVGTTVPGTAFPTARRDYHPEGVPKEIARDFQEALRCFDAGFDVAAALVGRRSLQAAIRSFGGKGPNLQTEIESLRAKLGPALSDRAHEVRLIGNDAAHSDPVSREDAEDLIDFCEEFLRHVFTMPARLQKRKAK